MKVLVTGSSGFIGSHLVPRLLSDGHEIVGLDRRRPATDLGGSFQFFKGSVLDASLLDSVTRGVETIIHLAAEHADFGVHDRLYGEVNTTGTRLVLGAAANAGVRDMIFFSSVAVYGEQPEPTHEGLTPRPASAYGRSKLAAEKLVERWAREADRRALILRPTVIYGPNNRENMFRLISHVADGRYVHVGDGSNIKSTGYIENMVDATLFLLQRLRAGCEVYNYADEPHLTSRQIAETLAAALNVRLRALTIPTGLAKALTYPLDVFANVTGWNVPVTANRIEKYTKTTHHLATKIRSRGFSPRYDSRAGLRKTARWFASTRTGHAAEKPRGAEPTP